MLRYPVKINFIFSNNLLEPNISLTEAFSTRIYLLYSDYSEFLHTWKPNTHLENGKMALT